MIQAIGIAAVGGLLVGSLATGVLTYKYIDNKWRAATAELKVEAADLLADEVDKVVKRERVLQSKVREMELDHEATTDTIQALKRTNSERIAKHGGMRDPGRRASGTHAMPSITTQTTGATNCPDSESRVLSRELTEELNTKAALADEMTAIAWQGYQWAIEVDKATKVGE